MNPKNFTFCIVLFLCLIGTRANAQWELFSDLLGQLDDDQQTQLFGDLTNIDNPNTDQFDLNLALDNLFNSLDNTNGDLDPNYIERLNECLENLNEYGDTSVITGIEQDTLLGELDRLNDIFNMEFDSLDNAFDNFQDSLGSDPDWDVTIFGFDDQVDDNLDILQDSVNTNMQLGSPTDIAGILGQLFSQSLFVDLELAFGIQNANLKYWGDEYSASASIIRVGSVPRLENIDVTYLDGSLQLPIEPYWHVQESFVSGRIPTSVNNDEFNAFQNNNNFNSLLLFGDYGMMTTPTIGRVGMTEFKLITSLGMEFGTYAPAHREHNPSRTAENRGYATGFGPQVGSGFAAKTGPLTIYSIGSVSRGDVINGPEDYKYNHVKVEAGIRYGNLINVRYSTSQVNWQGGDNRRANIGHQLTIGIILGSLPHNP